MTAIRNGQVDSSDVQAPLSHLDIEDKASKYFPQASSSQKRKSESSSTPPSSQSVVQLSQGIDLGDLDDDYMPIGEVPKDEHYIDVLAKVVGLQYYKGLVGDGEQVNLVREPTNPKDRWVQPVSVLHVYLCLHSVMRSKWRVLCK